MQIADGNWGISAVSLKSRTAYDQLVPQGGAYTSISLDATGRESQLIESISEVLVAPEDPQVVLSRLADPAVNIVTLTVTEKGYCHHPASGRLDLAHPDIVHDRAHPHIPRSAPGLIVEGLALRRAQTMVDRITPATTAVDIEALLHHEGYKDLGCVLHEPFRQWVIEDTFVGARPAWERAGAQLVASVDAHELMKLRCLNGTHSALAYLGYLAGFETIADTVSDPVFKRFVSQKLPQRLLGTISDNLDRGILPRGLCLAVAAWMTYVSGRDERGKPIDVRDPMASKLAEICQQNMGSADTVSALLKIDTIFDPGLAADESFRAALIAAHERLASEGAHASLFDA